jgi:hypothetical protein
MICWFNNKAYQQASKRRQKEDIEQILKWTAGIIRSTQGTVMRLRSRGADLYCLKSNPDCHALAIAIRTQKFSFTRMIAVPASYACCKLSLFLCVCVCVYVCTSVHMCKMPGI